MFIIKIIKWKMSSSISITSHLFSSNKTGARYICECVTDSFYSASVDWREGEEYISKVLDMLTSTQKLEKTNHNVII